MKKFLLLFTALICANMVFSSDISRSGYYGKVKKVTKICYKAEDKFDKPTIIKELSKRITFYNSIGNETKIEEYKEGELSFITNIEYDGNNKISKRYKADGTLVLRETFDKNNGQCLEKLHFSNGEVDNKSVYTYNSLGKIISSVISGTYSGRVQHLYENDTILLRDNMYDGDNNLTSVTTYKNDSQGRIISSSQRGVTYSTLDSDHTYEYDEHGNRTKFTSVSKGSSSVEVYEYGVQNPHKKWLLTKEKEEQIGGFFAGKNCTKYEYKFDKFGNTIHIRDINVDEDNNFENTIYITKFIFEYYE